VWGYFKKTTVFWLHECLIIVCCIVQCRRRVFRKLLYVILMMKAQERSKPSLLAPSQAVCGARDHAILFIRLVTPIPFHIRKGFFFK